MAFVFSRAECSVLISARHRIPPPHTGLQPLGNERARARSLHPVAISTAYAIIVFLANVVAVCVVLFLDRYGQAAVGSPPVVQAVK